jgi:SAM-dependent methyltransferase
MSAAGAGAITELPPLEPTAAGKPSGAGVEHPMRKVTQQVAFEPGAWDAERRRKVRDLFDSMAAEWNARDGMERHEALGDALDRGLPAAGIDAPETRPCVELGSGTGLVTPDLAQRFSSVLALDLSFEMLRRAPDGMAARVQADSSQLPLRDGAAEVLVLANMLLFPEEVGRVLAPRGALVWVSSLGDRTPIYLSTEDVLAALPGAWRATASAAGWGTWCVAQRVRP